MIPYVAKRGHSFKGAGQYYLHDKDSNTTERVEWTYIHNIPTDDAEKAMKWMAYTAMNRDKIKQQMGVPMTGRKSHEQPVYSFALGWHPEQEPNKSHMLDLAFDALDLLGLKDHESVIVAHNETEHPHIHVITNLVHPDTGKMVNIHNDYLRLSKWAERYEKEHGKIYCEERVKNNERRRSGELVKHREVKVDNALLIQNLYNQSDNGKAFQSALKSEGYTLAKGDKRGFVLVDEQGKVLSLSRQLNGQRAKDLKERLSDLIELPRAKTLLNEKPFLTCDDNEVKYQKNNADTKDVLEKDKPPTLKNLASEIDKKRKDEFVEEQKAFRKEHELRIFYKREDYQKKVENIQNKLKKELSNSERKQLQIELNDFQKTLGDIDKRMEEQSVDPIDTTVKDYSKSKSKRQKFNDSKPKQHISKGNEREDLRKKYKPKGKDRGNDFEPER